MAYIKLAYSREVDGKKHKAGAVIETDRSTAANLIHQGLATKSTKPVKAKDKTEANLQTTETNRKEEDN